MAKSEQQEKLKQEQLKQIQGLNVYIGANTQAPALNLGLADYARQTGQRFNALELPEPGQSGGAGGTGTTPYAGFMDSPEPWPERTGPRTYTVRAGDNPANIGRAFYGDERAGLAILAASGINPTVAAARNLQVGQVLILPDEVGDSALRAGGNLIAADNTQRVQETVARDNAYETQRHLNRATNNAPVYSNEGKNYAVAGSPTVEVAQYDALGNYTGTSTTESASGPSMSYGEQMRRVGGFVGDLGIDAGLGLINGGIRTVGTVISLIGPDPLVSPFPEFGYTGRTGSLGPDIAMMLPMALGARVSGSRVAIGAKGGGELANLEAQNIANAQRLANDLRLQSANSPFAANGTLTQDAIGGAKAVPGLGPGQLSNPAIPPGFGKYTTETFQSPAGNFQVHFYKNPTTGEIFYGLDYKAVFNNMSGIPKP